MCQTGDVGFLKKLQASLNPNNFDPDESIRHTLKEYGDDGMKPRLVDHFAYFNNDQDAAAFTTFIRDLGFELKESDEEFGVAFTKESPVVGKEFDAELAVLREKAIECNGQYDGWGSSVVTE